MIQLLASFIKKITRVLRKLYTLDKTYDEIFNKNAVVLGYNWFLFYVPYLDYVMWNVQIRYDKVETCWQLNCYGGCHWIPSEYNRYHSYH